MKIKVTNYSFKEYTELPEDEQEKVYLYLLRAKFKPVDIFKLGPFESRSFGFVKDMQYYSNEGSLTWQALFETVAEEKGIKLTKITNRGVYDLRQFLEYCTQQVDAINAKESTNLGRKPTSEEKEAGVSNFEKYKQFPQFDKLAQGDLRRFDEIAKLPYNLCFSKLMYDKETSDYENNINQIQIRNLNNSKL